jgi:hypothetical protein
MRSLIDINRLLNIFKPLPSGENLIIMTGMQKSGTTAIAKLLGAATDRRVCSDPLYRIIEKKGIDYRPELFNNQIPLETVWKKNQHLFRGDIIKDPDFVFMLPEIKSLFPCASLVFILRDPRDTIRSILNRLDLPGNPETNKPNLDDIPNSWKDTIMGTHPKITASNYIEVLTKRWCLTAEIYFSVREQCISIFYEDFKENKTDAISKLANQLGLEKKSTIEHLVDTQFQPKGNTETEWESFFGEEQLAVINKLTKPIEKKLHDSFPMSKPLQS